jgi:hypothetical protein
VWNKAIKSAAIIFLMGLLSLTFIGCESKQEAIDPKNNLKAEKSAQIKQSINNLAVKNNAVTDWKRKFEEADKVYTFQVEDALIKDHDRPVLAIGEVVDINRLDNKFYIHFNTWLDSGPEVHFILEITQEQVTRIINQPSERYFDNYAVVAKVISIERPKFEIGVYSESQEDYDLTVDESDIVIAKGVCLELLNIADYSEGE